MNIKRTAVIAVVSLLCSTLGSIKSVAANPVHDANELLAQHLNSIAAPEVRAGLKSRVVECPVHFAILVGGAGTLEGKGVLVSEGKKFQFMVRLPNNDYHGEQLVFDGKKYSIAFSSARQTRSPLGEFLFEKDEPLSEGLLGGALSTSWPLLNLDERRAKLKMNGLKKIDGQQLYEVRYSPRRDTDLQINLYFDPETYRHVETVYLYDRTDRIMQGGPTAQVGQVPSHYRLQEKFSDFKSVDGITLPTREVIQFSREPQNGRVMLYEWDLKDLAISNNVPVDSRNFAVK